jgi:hypothetical protein
VSSFAVLISGVYAPAECSISSESALSAAYQRRLFLHEEFLFLMAML